MKVIICEDELLIAENLKSFCNELGYKVIGIYSNKLEILDVLEHASPDIVLLDINLEGNKEGIDVANFINKHKKYPFIYITAYSDSETFNFASKTYPSAYLIKPIDAITLKINIELAMLKFNNKLHIDQSQTLVKLTKTPKDVSQIDFTNCIYITATQNYIHIYFSNMEKCILRYTISDLENILDSNFARVHKSYIVNLKFVSTILAGKLNILGTWIPIGRVFKTNLSEYLLE